MPDPNAQLKAKLRAEIEAAKPKVGVVLGKLKYQRPEFFDMNDPAKREVLSALQQMGIEEIPTAEAEARAKRENRKNLIKSLGGADVPIVRRKGGGVAVGKSPKEDDVELIQLPGDAMPVIHNRTTGEVSSPNMMEAQGAVSQGVGRAVIDRLPGGRPGDFDAIQQEPGYSGAFGRAYSTLLNPFDLAVNALMGAAMAPVAGVRGATALAGAVQAAPTISGLAEKAFARNISGEGALSGAGPDALEALLSFLAAAPAGAVGARMMPGWKGSGPLNHPAEKVSSGKGGPQYPETWNSPMGPEGPGGLPGGGAEPLALPPGKMPALPEGVTSAAIQEMVSKGLLSPAEAAVAERRLLEAFKFQQGKPPAPAGPRGRGPGPSISTNEPIVPPAPPGSVRLLVNDKRAKSPVRGTAQEPRQVSDGVIETVNNDAIAQLEALVKSLPEEQQAILRPAVTYAKTKTPKVAPAPVQAKPQAPPVTLEPAPTGGELVRGAQSIVAVKQDQTVPAETKPPASQIEPAPAPKPAPPRAGAKAVKGASKAVLNPDITPEEAVFGGKVKTYTPKGTEADVEYAVIPMERGIPSNMEGAANAEGMPWNPKYDSALQRRDATRKASEEHIERIASNLTPARLIDAPSTAEGAPIVGPDGQVESGNHRYMAMQRAARLYPEKYAGYVQSLKDNASKLGIDPAALDRVKNPVLVRVRRGVGGKSELTPEERAAFASEAGDSTVAERSDVEKASADAGVVRKIAGKFLSSDFMSAANRDAVQHFRNALPEAERNSFSSEDGTPSESGARRVRNAVLAAAYDSPDLVNALIDAPVDEQHIRLIGSALEKVSVRVLRVKGRIETGEIDPVYDIGPDLAEAAKVADTARRNGSSIGAYANTENMFGDEAGGNYSPVTKALLNMLDEFKRSSNKVADVVGRYYDAVEGKGGLLEEPLSDPADMIRDMTRQAKEQSQNERSRKQAVEKAKVEGVQARRSAEGSASPEPAASAPPPKKPPVARSPVEMGDPDKGSSAKREGVPSEELSKLPSDFNPFRPPTGSVRDRVAVEKNLWDTFAKTLKEEERDAWLYTLRRMAARYGEPHDPLLLGPGDVGGFRIAEITATEGPGSTYGVFGLAEHRAREVVSVVSDLLNRWRKEIGGEKKLHEAEAWAAMFDENNPQLFRSGFSTQDLAKAAQDIAKLVRSIAAWAKNGQLGQRFGKVLLKAVTGTKGGPLDYGRFAHVVDFLRNSFTENFSSLKRASEKAWTSVVEHASSNTQAEVEGYYLSEAVLTPLGEKNFADRARFGVYGMADRIYQLRTDLTAELNAVDQKISALKAQIRTQGASVSKSTLAGWKADGRKLRAEYNAIADHIGKLHESVDPVTGDVITPQMLEDFFKKPEVAKAVNLHKLFAEPELEDLLIEQGYAPTGTRGFHTGAFWPGIQVEPVTGKAKGGTGSSAKGWTKPVFRTSKVVEANRFTGTAAAYEGNYRAMLTERFRGSLDRATAKRMWTTLQAEGVAFTEAQVAQMREAQGLDSPKVEYLGKSEPLQKVNVNSKSGKAVQGLEDNYYLPKTLAAEFKPMKEMQAEVDLVETIKRLNDTRIAAYLFGPGDAVTHGVAINGRIGLVYDSVAYSKYRRAEVRANGIKAIMLPGEVASAIRTVMKGTGPTRALTSIWDMVQGRRQFTPQDKAEAMLLAGKYGAIKTRYLGEIPREDGAVARTLSGLDRYGGGKWLYGQNGMATLGMTIIYKFGKSQGMSEAQIGQLMMHVGNVHAKSLQSNLQRALQSIPGVATFYQTGMRNRLAGIAFGGGLLMGATSILAGSAIMKAADPEGKGWWERPGQKPTELYLGKDKKTGSPRYLPIWAWLNRPLDYALRPATSVGQSKASGASNAQAAAKLGIDMANWAAAPATSGPSVGTAFHMVGHRPYVSERSDKRIGLPQLGRSSSEVGEMAFEQMPFLRTLAGVINLQTIEAALKLDGQKFWSGLDGKAILEGIGAPRERLGQEPAEVKSRYMSGQAKTARHVKNIKRTYDKKGLLEAIKKAASGD